MKALVLLLFLAFAFPAKADEERIRNLSEKLRCLVCQNQSLADSPAELAVDLRRQVVAQIKAGRSDEQILEFMVQRYGDFVLYDPPFKLSTWLLWLGPFVLLAAAGAAILVILRRRRDAAEPLPLGPEDKRVVAQVLGGERPGDAKQ